MKTIIEQIAKEVMLKLKSESTNRGSAYTPPPRTDEHVTGSYSTGRSYSATPAKGQTAILLTANFKVIDQVISQLPTLATIGTKVITSTYLYNNYGKDSLGKNLELLHSGNVPSNKALQNISELIIPSLSVNTLSKAANLVADTYITRVICHALGDGIRIVVTDESIIEPENNFPVGVAKKISHFRHELEEMGVIFKRCSTLKIIPDKSSPMCNKCSSTGACTGSCSPSGCGSSGLQTESPRRLSEPPPLRTTSNKPIGVCAAENCKNVYGSCSSNCAERVKEVIKAGAERIEKGLDAPIPGKELAGYIDHTLLKANATRDEIIKLCEEAKEHTFASVCVNPTNVALAARLLRGTPVKVCTVIGFPLGATSSFVKAMETRDAVANGATEIDMVINVGALKSKDYELVKNDIARVVESASDNIVKVILETSLLNNEEKIKACELSKLVGADFVKTSTGFSSGGATLEDICLMRQTVGPNMGVKASGGIRDTETTVQMIQAGATRVGASASVSIVKGEKTASKGY